MSALKAIPPSRALFFASRPNSRQRRGPPVLSAGPVTAAQLGREAGARVFPRFILGSGFDSAPSSLSVWKDIESLMAFAYSGVHADALKHARNWNVKPSWPPLVLWWVDGRHIPDWSEGVERLEHLHDNGATARAFTFKEANSSGQADLLAHVQSLKA